MNRVAAWVLMVAVALGVGLATGPAWADGGPLERLWSGVRAQARGPNFDVTLRALDSDVELEALAALLGERVRLAGGAVTSRTVEGGRIRLVGFLDGVTPEGLDELFAPRRVTMHRMLDGDAHALFSERYKADVAPPDGVELAPSFVGRGRESAVLLAASDDLGALQAYLDGFRPARGTLMTEDQGQGASPRYRAALLGPVALRIDRAYKASVIRDPLGAPAIAVTLSADDARAFEAVTRECVGSRLAIVLDGDVVSIPVVMEPIAGGSVQIALGTGGGTLAELEALAGRIAVSLVAPPLPSRVERVAPAAGSPLLPPSIVPTPTP
jgi:preprotein translocase subunit SecD